MEENLRRIHRSVMACFLYSYCHSAAWRSEFYSCASLSSLGSIRISSRPCLKRNSRNYKSQVHPSHRNDKIPLTDSRTKMGKWQRTKRRERKWVCISGGGNEKNTLRRTVARMMRPVAFQSWTTVWTCSRDVPVPLLALTKNDIAWEKCCNTLCRNNILQEEIYFCLTWFYVNNKTERSNSILVVCLCNIHLQYLFLLKWNVFDWSKRILILRKSKLHCLLKITLTKMEEYIIFLMLLVYELRIQKTTESSHMQQTSCLKSV